jgi:hypothetical protein
MVVRQGYYAYDYYGRTIWVPPIIRRACY